MIALVMDVLNSHPAGLFYSRKPTVFGNEAELRWKRYHNSRCWCMKMEFNLSDEEHDAITHLILLHQPGARIVP